jgi:hypothetical protein
MYPFGAEYHGIPTPTSGNSFALASFVAIEVHSVFGASDFDELRKSRASLLKM